MSARTDPEPTSPQPARPAAQPDADRFNVRIIQPTQRTALLAEIARIESYAEAVERVASKAWLRLLHFDGVPPHPAMLLKQELLALGGDALITPEVYLGTAAAPTPVLAWASERAWLALCRKLSLLPVDALQQLGRAISQALGAIDAAERGSLTLAGRTWRWGERTLVMGIINATPDSFSHDGLLSPATALTVAQQAAALAVAGADILDIGGESTRPGATTVTLDEELARVIPAIQAARQACDLPISVDTYKAEVAVAALDAGAHLVNDIWGLRTPSGEWNLALAGLVAERGVPIVLMHNRRASVAANQHGHHFSNVAYSDLTGEVCAELREGVRFALDQGIAPGQIVLDPGIGFGKTPAQNIELLQHLAELQALGYPLLVGTSRKSFIGLALNKPVEERIFGTAATVSHAIMHGADIIRVHDVAAMVDVCRMTDALVRQRPQ
ncbi:MAG: dihydropteroate synthase [Herpetosiphonaceae bacterium]|nr:dihydropteroate synthase [Herpetosiphonaceae bacterium]